MKSALIDISVFVDEDLASWPESPPVSFKKWKDMGKGDVANDTISMSSVHTGTHIDAPLHFVDGGASVDQIALSRLMGEAVVADFTGLKTITAEDLSRVFAGKKHARILLKTDNSSLWKTHRGTFQKEYTALASDAAQWLVDRQVGLIGIDYYSIQHFHDGPEVHQILLNAGVVILEGINLADVRPGSYHLTALPIKLRGVEAAPVRAVLHPLEEQS